MTNPSDTSISTGIQHRRPRAGERTRGAVDALQTKIADRAQAVGEKHVAQWNVWQDEIKEHWDQMPMHEARMAAEGIDWNSAEALQAVVAGDAEARF